MSALLQDEDEILSQSNSLPIKCTELVVIGSELDTDHSGPFRRFIEDLAPHQKIIPIHEHKIRSQSEFEILLGEYAKKARTGACPLVHIDMHGSEDCGLWIGDDQYVSWTKLCELLSAINRHTKNRMMVILFSCYGFHAIKSPDTNKPVPFVMLAAPGEEILTSELVDSVVPFYNKLFEEGIDGAWLLLRPQFQIFIPEIILRDKIVPELARNFTGKRGQSYKEKLLTAARASLPSGIELTPKEGRSIFKKYKANLAKKMIDNFRVYLCGRDPCFDVQKAIDQNK